MNLDKDYVISKDSGDCSFSSYATYRSVYGKEHDIRIDFSFQKSIFSKILEHIFEIYDKDDFNIKECVNYSETDHDYDDYGNTVILKNIGPYRKENILFELFSHRTSANFNILTDVRTEKLNKLIDIIQGYMEVDIHKPTINIIGHGQNGFNIKSFEFKIPKIDNVNFEDCYNDDFLSVAAHIEQKLKIENGKGIVLLHGIMGSGKTYYLRNLITKIPEKKIIYMPPDLADRISSPDFVTFLINHPNSILFIEDAESALKSRNAGGNVAVSNLLNVSDGILGDALHLQIVCTFNCPKEEIDSALMRPGRLIAEYKFDELTEDKTTNLVQKLYGDNQIPEKSRLTVADIFNMEEKLHISKVKTKAFGFIPST